MKEFQHLEKSKDAFAKGRLPSKKQLRKCLHPVMIRVVKLSRLLAKQALKVVHDDRDPNTGTVIYACNHIGWDDIQMTFEPIQDHAWLFWGNPEYGTPHYYVLMANGAICVDTYDKEDRGIAKQTAIKLLRSGQSLLIYPEGAWNAIPNLPVMRIFSGTAEIAITAGVDIVPIGIAQNGPDEYFVSIGRNISSAGYEVSDKWKLTEIIRDAIAAEVWTSWEAMYPTPLKRSELPENAEQEFEDFLTSQMHDAFTLEDVHKERYHDAKEDEHMLPPLRLPARIRMRRAGASQSTLTGGTPV